MCKFFMAAMCGLALFSFSAWGTTPKTIQAIDVEGLSDSELSLLASLMGVVAKTSPEIYLAPRKKTANPGPSFWLELYLKDDPARTVQWNDHLMLFVKDYASKLKGYVLYGPGTEGLNAATSLAGVLDAVVVNEHTEAMALYAGLKRLADTRGKTDSWAWKQYGPRFNRKVIASLNPNIALALRDYTIFQKAFVYYESPYALDYLGAQLPHSLVFGWGASEFVFFQNASKKNLQALASDYLHNASVLSQWTVAVPPQKTHVDLPLEPEDSVHYVAFVMSDGDNPQWLTNTFAFDQKWWASPRRGTFTMNWDLSPGFIDVSSLTYRYLHESASQGSAKDYFVTAHGVGSDYPSEVPDLRGALAQTVGYMQKTDQSMLSILDNRWDPKTIDTILETQSIEGVMFKFNGCCGYKSRDGKVYWHNGKPAIAVKYSLWEGYDTTDDIVAGLNASSRRPLLDDDAYSVVNVHPWSPDPMENVAKIVARLDSQVRVVTLEELVLRLRANRTPKP
ncbi:hypothetical protein K2X33_08350 [bacterium]|nr:hypothetical protein [bacterium]